MSSESQEAANAQMLQKHGLDVWESFVLLVVRNMEEKKMKRTSLVLVGLAAIGLAAVGMLGMAQNKTPFIGLITKTESNPFFVKMKEGASKEAARLGAKFISAAGKQDGDNAGQVAAIENMVAAGVNTILITPSDAKAIIPAIQKAQAAGVQVIALDSPTDPESAVDALFATNNYQAGVLIGEYAATAMRGKKAVIATLDLFPGHPVGAQRHNGFLQGFQQPCRWRIFQQIPVCAVTESVKDFSVIIINS